MAAVTEAQVPQWKRDLIQRRKASKNPQLSSDSSQIPENDEKSLETEKPQICQKVPVTIATCPHSDNNKLESPRQQSVACNMRLEVEVPPPMESPKSLNHLPEDSIKSKILRLHKSEALNCESLRPMKTDNNKVMEDCESDSSEELQYGPGIVNKLKSKYLNLTLREMNKNRKIVTKFRRAASLEDLLDCEEDESKRKFVKKPQNETSDRFRNIKRGNESMKRARSVETLMRYQEEEKVIKKVNDPVNDHIVLIDRTIVKIESKLMNNERKPLNKPKRLKPLLDDTERPPQDLVKTTLKLFEGSVKKVKPKGDVAVKIATFKTINDTFKMGMKKGGKMPMVQGVKPPVQPKPLVNGNGVGFVRKIAEKLQEEKGGEVDEGVGCVSAVVSKFQMIERGSSSPCASPEPVRIKSPVPSPEPVKIKATSPEPCARVKECANLVMKVDDAGDVGDVEENGVGQLEGEKEKVREEEVERIVKTVQNVPEKEKKKESPKQIGIIRPLVAVKRVEGLSHRELEKNLINRVKSSEKSVVVSLKNTEDVDVGKGGDCGDGGGGSGGLWDSKPWNQQNNTMIFNFSNRKDVPDYIENDGLIIRRKKEKPKAGDSGILVLDATLDASTTDDSDWEISGGPPSPCDVSFTNDNILINGRSNISRTPRNHKHRIQFNDEATRTFEYPSEASMLEDDGTSHVDGETSTAENNDDCQLSNSNKTACSMSSTGNPTSPILGGGGLASFTPSKVDLTSEGFELGITRSLHSSACGIDQSKTSENPTKIEEIEENEDVKSTDDSAAWGAEATADLLY